MKSEMDVGALVTSVKENSHVPFWGFARNFVGNVKYFYC